MIEFINVPGETFLKLSNFNKLQYCKPDPKVFSERIEELVARKRWMGQAYNERLKDVQYLQLPVEEPWAKNVYWMYGVVVDESTGIDAAILARLLKREGIETRPFFLGMHEQPVLQKQGIFKNEHYPVAERIARQGLYLPSGLALTESQVDKVCEAVRKVIPK